MNGTETILSSTGRLGVSRRQYERLYVNSTSFSSDPVEIKEIFQRLIAIGERNQQKIGRIIFRGLVNDSIIQHIASNDLQAHLEVAFPVAEFTGDNSWLIYMAQNRPGRESIVPREIMIDETSNIQTQKLMPPVARVQSMIEKGYSFTNLISAHQVDHVYALWGETFGWERQHVDNLKKRLLNNKCKDSSDRDIWFAGACDNGTIICAAMAERLTIPAALGQLDLIESTEWRTKDEYSGNGLMTATVALLNAQILSDLKDSTDGLPLICAECNFQSRSDRVGVGAGFRIPGRVIGDFTVPQILVQNVLVRDGQPIDTSKLRDFTFMYLPVETMKTHYSPMQAEAIMHAVQL